MPLKRWLKYILRRCGRAMFAGVNNGLACDAAAIAENVNARMDNLALRLGAIEQCTEYTQRVLMDNEQQHRDIILLFDRLNGFLPAKPYVVQTDYPVASTSNDHLAPRGTKNDNTRSPRFVQACEKIFDSSKLAYLDLGCAGGGLVFDFLLRGHDAIGLEGSDYSLLRGRAEWRLLGQSALFTADVTKPFSLFSPDMMPYRAQVITAWELLEHITEECLPQLFANVAAHLSVDGFFIGSVALYEDNVNGVPYHHTVKPEAWWREVFEQHGFAMLENHLFVFYDFCRGTGNGYFDSNFALSPGLGFHFVAQQK